MISVTILLASLGCVMANEFTPLYEWKHFDYVWENKSEKQLAISTGLYNYTRVILYDAELYKDRLFVTTPRTHDVNPASLNTISTEQDADGHALLQPYPSPEWHAVGNCSGITNALKFFIDECDNMWIVDSGTIDNEVVCRAHIHKFDLKTNQRIMQYEIPEEVSKGGLLSTNAVITEGDQCENITLFSADLRGSGYVIFDGSRSWRLESDNFKPDINTIFTVDGRTVNMTYGPIGFLILDKPFVDVQLGLMWPLSRLHGYGLSIQDLVNSRDSQENLQWYKVKHELSSPVTAGIISKQGIMFGAYIGREKLKCVWLGNDISSENMVTLIEESDFSPLITSMRILTADDGSEHLMIAVNDYMRLMAGTADFREVTSGLYIAKIIDLTNGTRCQPKADTISAKSLAEEGLIPL